jgi:molybdate transport system substrate-binding protein
VNIVVCVALLVAVPLATGSPGLQSRAKGGELLVAAAASLSVVATDLARAAHDQLGLVVRFNFGGSNTLARQIAEGAPADLFISADETQMTVVERAGRVVRGSRVDLLSNQLVVVIPTSSARPSLTPTQLGGSDIRRVAMGDPAAVPAGVYGRVWLEQLGVWPSVQRKVVALPSSRAVVAAVREGRADAGIVYATDARGVEGVRVAHTVATKAGPRIVYPAAVITGERVAQARAFLEWLQSHEARRLFEAAGFRLRPAR